MREYTVGRNDAGQRLDRFIGKVEPGLSPALLQKTLRKKDVKINGRPARGDARLAEGDQVRIYLTEEFFGAERRKSLPAQEQKVELDIAYEDGNILVADKRPGVLCHDAGGAWSGGTLIAQIQTYLRQKGEWDPRRENSFAPALCNRIDRNIGGLVIAAKNAAALRVMDGKIKNREIEKTYLCAVLGSPRPAAGRLEGYLFKDAKKNQVYVYDAPRPGALTAATEYRTLSTAGELSLLECRLITGRTHQIRAQMAHAGWPLLGDGKYGVEKKNRAYGEKRQLLHSYRLRFAFREDGGELNYLNGVTVQGSVPAFAEKYFRWQESC